MEKKLTDEPKMKSFVNTYAKEILSGYDLDKLIEFGLAAPNDEKNLYIEELGKRLIYVDKHLISIEKSLDFIETFTKNNRE